MDETGLDTERGMPVGTGRDGGCMGE